MSSESETRHLYGRAIGMGLAGLAGLATQGVLPATVDASPGVGGWDLKTNKKARYDAPDMGSAYKFGVSVGIGDLDADNDGTPDMFLSSVGGDDGAMSFMKFDGLSLAVHKHFRPRVMESSVDTRVAAADLDRDGRMDLITCAGEGASSSVSVISVDSLSSVQGPLAGMPAFSHKLTNGVYVATGDVDGDDFSECFVSSSASFDDQSGLPLSPSSVRQVTVENAPPGHDGQLTAHEKFRNELFAYGTSYTGGIRVAVGDVDGDGHAEVATLNESGASRTVIFHKHEMGPNGVDTLSPTSELELSSTLPDGASCSIAVGDIDGDGFDDLAVGAAMGEAPLVRLYSWEPPQLPLGPEGTPQGTWILTDSFEVYDSSYLGGVNVGLTDFTGDGLADLVFSQAFLVPEPTTAALVCGAALFAGRRRRR
ncbi:MAG TPA: PEP-CTERM sorting domain-containing protein [Tepidisphaeraceae bacterium]|nr:PEP-CTERM sorting domain-containing protein [Tepidisphaeraceae bacterium]